MPMASYIVQRPWHACSSPTPLTNQMMLPCTYQCFESLASVPKDSQGRPLYAADRYFLKFKSEAEARVVYVEAGTNVSTAIRVQAKRRGEDVGHRLHLGPAAREPSGRVGRA